MDREHYIKDMPKHIEKIRAQVARISASEEICQQAIQLIREILEAANSTIIIDANDHSHQRKGKRPNEGTCRAD